MGLKCEAPVTHAPSRLPQPPEEMASAVSNAVFTYFRGRGHGERVRVALSAAGIKYVEKYLVAPGDMDAVRPRCMLGQVPLLEMGGESFVQSWAIVRHLARFNNMTPASEVLAARADACFEQCRDWTTAANFVGFGWPGSDSDADKEKMRVASLKHATVFERLLSPQSPFLTGTSPCWADFQLMLCCNIVTDYHAGVLSAFPRLAAHHASCRAAPEMADYYASHCNTIVDAAYIASVRAAQQTPGPAA